MIQKKEFKKLLRMSVEDKRKAVEKMNAGERMLLDIYIDKQLKRADKVMFFCMAFICGVLALAAVLLIISGVLKG